jgi:hypothetical protein
MSNNKKSSIEWLDDKLASLNFDYLTGQIDNKEYNERHKAIMEQAKAMHKEEMVDFGNDLIAQNDINYIGMPNLAEQYYNQTFGGEK